MKILKKLVKPFIILLIVVVVLGAGHHLLKWILSTNGICDNCGKNEAVDVPEKFQEMGVEEELCKDCVAKLKASVY